LGHLFWLQDDKVPCQAEAGMRKRTSYNPKKGLLPADRFDAVKEILHEFASKVQYGGNPEHKRNPGDFNLVPPSAPRRGKSLCDDVELFKRSDALKLLRNSLKMGLVDARWTGEGWPQIVWAVTAEGYPLEAQREADGVYHGYPMPEADPFRALVLERWRAVCATA
jgi:hypothetical protein